ncbi:hypothetical protein ACF1E9_19115 [Streptomyces roseolus]|uniref:hypothetical protein n=1 Tax=Streptomyces TaxID=1883 RepID=UPI0036EEA755
MIGGGWRTYHHVTGFGDLDRDGYADLVGITPYGGDPYVYTGTGNRLAPFAGRKALYSSSDLGTVHVY